MKTRFYFDSTNAQQRLIHAVGKWIGTPFHPHASVCGAGVDCVHLAAELYRECGVLTDYEFPRYVMDGGQHDDSSKVVEWVESSRRFVRCDYAADHPAPGDLLCFRIGRVAYHVGIALNRETFVQVFQGGKVALYPCADATWKSRIVAIYAPVIV
jgi:cell wall-associated NlpC family hydrolase